MKRTVGPSFDPGEFRKILGHYASGLTVVSGMSDGEPAGMAIQSFFSHSIDPPFVVLSFQETSTTYPKLRRNGGFGVNILSVEQADFILQFGRSGADKWAGVEWHPSDHGNPRIAGALVWFDCEIQDERLIGDHYLTVARVVAAETPGGDAEPLLYFKSQLQKSAKLG